MDINSRETVDGVNKLEEALARVRAAQKKFSAYTQDQVDNIFKAAAIAANRARLPLAKLAVEETGTMVVRPSISRPSTCVFRILFILSHIHLWLHFQL